MLDTSDPVYREAAAQVKKHVEEQLRPLRLKIAELERKFAALEAENAALKVEMASMIRTP